MSCRASTSALLSWQVMWIETHARFLMPSIMFLSLTWENLQDNNDLVDLKTLTLLEQPS